MTTLLSQQYNIQYEDDGNTRPAVDKPTADSTRSPGCSYDKRLCAQKRCPDNTQLTEVLYPAGVRTTLNSPKRCIARVSGLHSTHRCVVASWCPDHTQFVSKHDVENETRPPAQEEYSNDGEQHFDDLQRTMRYQKAQLKLSKIEHILHVYRNLETSESSYCSV